MTAIPPLVADEFPEIFNTIHGCSPFPWQARLAETVAKTGSWPDALDLPTGTGKTAAIDVALFHLALEVDRGEQRKAPVRIAFVVDRRIIVDEAALRAERIASALASASGGSPLARMAARLRHLAGEEMPLVVRTLRGGIPRENDWARTPAQATVLCSTVDQVGSRLLFRGYGVSDSMKPIHAGLLGSDCLFLLDEAHLAAPFAQTLRRIATYRAPPWCEGEPAPWRFVALSATPQDNTGTFGLTKDDRTHPVLKKRLGASKPASLRLLRITAKEQPKEHAEAFADAVVGLLGDEKLRTGAVVVNRVSLARAVFEILSERLDGTAEVLLLTGRTRGLDRDELVQEYAGRLKSGAVADGRRLVAVATQTIEAGADFDFDALVTQVAPLDSLRQRFGRLNRMGRPVPASAIILAAKDEVAARADDPIYGDRAKKTWEWLSARSVKPGKKAEPIVDFGLDAFDKITNGAGAELAALVTEKPDAPILRPADVMLLSWTSPIPAVDPAIEPLLHGPKAAAADVKIVWRADIDEGHLRDAHSIISTVPPHTGETLAVPLWAARAWLEGASSEAETTADLEGVPAAEVSGRFHRRAFRWAGADSQRTGPVTPGELRPGDVVVVPSAYGGCDRFGWNPRSRKHVADLGDQRRATYHWAKRLHPLLTPDLWSRVAGAVSPESDTGMTERVAILKEAGLDVPTGKMTLLWPEGYEGAVVVGRGTEPSSGDAATESDDIGSVARQPVTLVDHSDPVQRKAEAFAQAAGFAPERIADVSLAALLHDLGKADARFQIWLRGGDRLMAEVEADAPLAKSAKLMTRGESLAARRTAGMPDHWRHEAQSVTRAIDDPRLRKARDAELVLWLVGTHHGHGRPLFPHNDPRHPGPERIDFTFGGWDWPQLFERLRERYGLWELARMEAVLRLADHRASEEAEA